MVVFFYIPGNILLLLAAVMLLGSIVFAIWYAIMQAKEENEKLNYENLSAGKRIGVLLNLLIVFASMVAVAYGFINNNGIWGTIGVLAWMVASLIIAYMCSPLRLFWVDQSASKQGCAYILFYPLFVIISTVSLILIMLISWIFGLAAVLKGLSKLVYVFIACFVVFFSAAGVGLNLYQQHKDQMEKDNNFQLVEDAMAQVIQDIEIGTPKKIVFDEETQLAMEYYNVESFFGVTEVREVIANKFSQLYQNKDVDGLLDFLAFLDSNYAYLIEKDDVYDICFSDAYITALKDYIVTNGVYVKTNGDNEIYTYKDYEIWLVPFGCYIKLEYTLDGKENSGTVILGTTGYRSDQHETYDESSPGYFLVGEDVELVESKIENSEDLANKYYPAATCLKCGTGFRANTLRARMIAEHGYCGMGLCGKD